MTPGNAQRRPGGGGAAENDAETALASQYHRRHLPAPPPTRWDAASGLRNRRGAARRTECLPDGRRDPLDKPQSGTGAHITVRLDRHSIFFAGGWELREHLQGAGVRHMRTPNRHEWTAPIADASTVIETLERLGYLVTLNDQWRPADE